MAGKQVFTIFVDSIAVGLVSSDSQEEAAKKLGLEKDYRSNYSNMYKLPSLNWGYNEISLLRNDLEEISSKEELIEANITQREKLRKDVHDPEMVRAVAKTCLKRGLLGVDDVE